MPEKYYLDTSIYIDYYENRSDNLRPLGDWAHRLLSLIRAKKDILLVSDVTIRELRNHLSEQELSTLFENYEGIIEKTEITKAQFDEARLLSVQREVPFYDALHAVIARDNRAVLVTRDRHFLDLIDISKPFKPEDII